MSCCVPLASGCPRPDRACKATCSPSPDPTLLPKPVPSLGFCPVSRRLARLTMMQLGLLMDHRLTRQSSPPVASSRPEALPSTSEDTLLAWATISSTRERTGGKGIQRRRPLVLAREAQAEGSAHYSSPLVTPCHEPRPGC